MEFGPVSLLKSLSSHHHFVQHHNTKSLQNCRSQIFCQLQDVLMNLRIDSWCRHLGYPDSLLLDSLLLIEFPQLVDGDVSMWESLFEEGDSFC